jgi:hypothetical protein
MRMLAIVVVLVVVSVAFVAMLVCLLFSQIGGEGIT